MNRQMRAALAKETLEVLSSGEYRSPSGRVIDISQALTACLAKTRLWRPNEFPNELIGEPASSAATTVEVTDETTLAAARRVTQSQGGGEVLCLNFASAKNPGGGFLSGAQAQEESLVRASGLYASLASQSAMYEYNRRLRTWLYSDHMIYSPHVPVFRDDEGKFLEEPYFVSFITAPAVNAEAVRRNEPQNVPAIQRTMARRLGRLLWVAMQMGHSAIILGAWGCGVFGNDPADVAEIFRHALGPSGTCRKWFGRVAYAVYDRSPGKKTLSTFRGALDEAND